MTLDLEERNSVQDEPGTMAVTDWLGMKSSAYWLSTYDLGKNSN